MIASLQTQLEMEAFEFSPNYRNMMKIYEPNAQCQDVHGWNELVAISHTNL